jgi:hypothetical protein
VGNRGIEGEGEREREREGDRQTNRETQGKIGIQRRHRYGDKRKKR